MYDCLSICQALSKCEQVGQLFWPKTTLSIVPLQNSCIDFWREAQQSNGSVVGALPPVFLFEDGEKNCRLSVHSSSSFRLQATRHTLLTVAAYRLDQVSSYFIDRYRLEWRYCWVKLVREDVSSLIPFWFSRWCPSSSTVR